MCVCRCIIMENRSPWMSRLRTTVTNPLNELRLPVSCQHCCPKACCNFVIQFRFNKMTRMCVFFFCDFQLFKSRTFVCSPRPSINARWLKLRASKWPVSVWYTYRTATGHVWSDALFLSCGRIFWSNVADNYLTQRRESRMCAQSFWLCL